MGGSTENGGDVGPKCEANKEEAKEVDKEVEKEVEKEIVKEVDKEVNKEGEAKAAEESATGEIQPMESESTDVNGPMEALEDPEEKSKMTQLPKKAPKFKQRKSKEFKSRPPKKGVLG